MHLVLMRAWVLPELLVRICDDHHAQSAQVRYVVLANRLALHTRDGWDNAAFPDDVSDIAALLNLRPESTLRIPGVFMVMVVISLVIDLSGYAQLLGFGAVASAAHLGGLGLGLLLGVGAALIARRSAQT